MQTAILLVVMIGLAVLATYPDASVGRRVFPSMALGGLFTWALQHDTLLFLNGLVCVGVLFSLIVSVPLFKNCGIVASALGFLGTLALVVASQVAVSLVALIMIMAFPVEGTHDLNVPLPWQITASVTAQALLIGARIWLAWSKASQAELPPLQFSGTD